MLERCRARVALQSRSCDGFFGLVRVFDECVAHSPGLILDGQLVPTLEAAAADQVATARGPHPVHEAMPTEATSFLRLPCTLGHGSGSSKSRARVAL